MGRPQFPSPVPEAQLRAELHTTMPDAWLLGPYIGARVRELRGQRSIGRTSVAQRAGLTLPALAALEAGEVLDIPVSVLYALAQALRVKPSTLLPERLAARKGQEASP